ncbi:MAG: alpha/beta fold hydrolase [Desulfobacterales bacterium]|nr:alpha/beta fold hydrolase [Desulfobacterales bacterium]
MRVKVKDISVNYEFFGRKSAPVVVCSHCLSGNINIWDSQIDALKESYSILRYDVRGHGGTSAPEGDYTVEMLADDALGLMDELGIDKAHFMGISMGGMIGQTMALEYPERLSSLILCDTACQVPQESIPLWQERIAVAKQNGMEALADDTMDRWLSPEFQEKYPEAAEKIRGIILNTPVDGFVGCCRAISGFDVKDRLPQLSMPVLIMVGENDPGTTVEASREIQNQISNSRLEVLPKALHLSNIEAAESFNYSLMDFLWGCNF